MPMLSCHSEDAQALVSGLVFTTRNELDLRNCVHPLLVLMLNSCSSTDTWISQDLNVFKHQRPL